MVLCFGLLKGFAWPKCYSFHMTDHGFDSKWKGITDPLEVQSSLTFFIILYWFDGWTEFR